MKNRIGFAITLAGAVLCALPNLAMAQSGQNGDSQGGQAAPIEGTWIVKITRVQPGNPTITWSVLTSFTAGGVILATGTIDRLMLPSPISPLYGTWKRVGDNGYAANLNFFAFDTAGNPLAMIINPLTFQLTDDNTLAGASISNAPTMGCPVIGYVVTEPCGTALGTLTIKGTRLPAVGTPVLP